MTFSEDNHTNGNPKMIFQRRVVLIIKDHLPILKNV